jgi:hypothetical protein
MKNKLIGVVILVCIVAAAIGIKTMGLHKSVTTFKGIIGGEKSGLLEDPAINKILRDKYGVVLDYAKAGSIEMVQGQTPAGTDFLWPSNQTALELYKINKNSQMVNADVIFNSPIVLYSWDIIADALIKQSIVKRTDSSYFIVDFPKLVKLVTDGKKWSDIGLPELYGRISIISTDPNKSNSGNMFSGLIANILYGDVVNDSTVTKELPTLRTFFKNLGFLEHSSSDLFMQYLSTGVGAKPIIVGYESQIVEFSAQNEKTWPSIKHKVRILYPQPTVWSSHPLIAITPRAEIVLKAFKDETIQKIAWEKHGFRTGLIGVQNDPHVLSVVGIPERINQVIPLPGASTLETIMNAIKQ